MNKKLTIVMLCVAAIIMSVAYAIFSSGININGTAEITSIWDVQFTTISCSSTGNSEYDSSNAVTTNGLTATVGFTLIAPGSSAFCDITVKNFGTLPAKYMSVSYSGLSKEELAESPIIVTLTEPTNVTSSLINSNDSHVWRVTATYDDVTTPPTTGLTKSATITLNYQQDLGQEVTPGEPDTGETTLLLANKILEHNNAQSDENINFGQTSAEDGTRGLYYTSTNTTNNGTTYYFRGDVDNNHVKFGTETKSMCTFNGYQTGYINVNTGEATSLPTEDQCTNVTHVCALPDEFVSVYGFKYVTGADEATCTSPDIGGIWTEGVPTYETSTRNIYWRIVRINEDGSIRLIYQGNSATGNSPTIGSSVYNSESNSDEYVGYMYTLGSAAGRGTSSTVKGVLDTWYNNNLSNYSSYLTTTGFCNDRSLSSGTGIGNTNTQYGAYNRLINNKNPQFACPNPTYDLFTTQVGLITADEVAYAGGVINKENYNYYLNSGAFYWTMSPSDFYGSYASVWLVRSRGSLNTFNVDFGVVGGGFGVRPVINLRSDVEIISGDGKIGSEYVIKVS